MTVVRRLLTVIVALSLSSVGWYYFYGSRRINSDRAEATVKEIRSAEAAFKKTNGRYGTLDELAAAGLIDSSLRGGAKSGYRFHIDAEKESYRATATSTEHEEHGSWSFYLDESGVVRGRCCQGQADASDPAVRYQE